MVEINNTTRQRVKLKEIRDIVTDFLRVYHKNNYEVSVALIGAKRMRRLNNDYRDQDKVTDVLSFSGEQKYLGEVIINLEETKKTTKYLEIFQERKTSAEIFYFLLVHGLLHLVGYDDDTETARREMIRRGANFLNVFRKGRKNATILKIRDFHD